MKKIIIIFTITLIMLTNNYQVWGESVNNSIDINNGWQYLNKTNSPDKYSDSNYVLNNVDLTWNNFSIPNKPKYASPGGEVWVRVKLPEGKFKDPSILFMTYDQIFQIYLDKNLIYKFGDFSKASKMESPGSPWHIISLPDEYKDKFLYIKMYSARKVNQGLIKKFELGTKSNHLTYLIKQGIMSFVQSCIYVFVGIFALFFAVIRKNDRKLIFYLGLAATITGFWLISEGTMKQFFFDNPVFWVYIDIISQYSIPIVYGLLINELFEGIYKKILFKIIYVHIFILIFALTIDALNILPLVATLPVFYISFGINMLIMIILVATSFKKWSNDIKIFTSGFSMLCICGILDLINSVNRSHTNIIFTKIGIFIFLTSLAFLTLYHVIKTQDKVHRYLDELNSKEIILTEKKRQLDEAIINDQLKTEFFSNISHELKTPLNIILSIIQLLHKYTDEKLITSEEKDLYRYLYMMKQNSYRLIRLVNNLIDMTKIDAGYLNTDLKNYDIVTVVEDITQSVADYIKEKGLSITFDTNVEEKIIACDPDKIERIMLNLLSNSVKFSKPGSSIFVEVNDNDTEVEIKVLDTGIGLEKDKLEVIFERFAQVDKSLTRSHEGSGIGLSLVKSLVKLHGGKISVESEYGKGSVFTIVLPANITEFKNQEISETELHAAHVEKVNIEFSDIYS
jgi:signal transduction histidine kinase